MDIPSESQAPTISVIRPLRSDAVRNQRVVLDAAKSVFAKRGRSAGFDEIARVAGVGVGTVYRRFPDRQALLDALFDERLEAVTALANDCLAAPEPFAGFERFVIESSAMFADDRWLRELTFDSEADPNHGVDRARASLVPILRAITERARTSGELRADFEPADLANLIAMLSSLPDHPNRADGWGGRDAWSRSTRFLIDGVRAR